MIMEKTLVQKDPPVQKQPSAQHVPVPKDPQGLPIQDSPTQGQVPQSGYAPVTSTHGMAARGSFIDFMTSISRPSLASFSQASNVGSNYGRYVSDDEVDSSDNYSCSESDEPLRNDGPYDELTGRVNRYSLKDRHYVPVLHMTVPFMPELLSVEFTHHITPSSTASDPSCLTLRAIVVVEEGQECTYAVDPKAGTIIFLVTTRSSMKSPGKNDIGMIVAGCSKRFPTLFDWNLGVVLNSGQDGFWTCHWPRMGKQLPEGLKKDDIVDILVGEDDFGFSLDGGICNGSETEVKQGQV